MTSLTHTTDHYKDSHFFNTALLHNLLPTCILHVPCDAAFRAPPRFSWCFRHVTPLGTSSSLVPTALAYSAETCALACSWWFIRRPVPACCWSPCSTHLQRCRQPSEVVHSRLGHAISSKLYQIPALHLFRASICWSIFKTESISLTVEWRHHHHVCEKISQSFS